MKHLNWLWICLIAVGTLNAQTMNPKQHRFAEFEPDVYVEQVNDLWMPDSMAQHPEFGIQPYNKQCPDCVEMIGMRDAYHRYYVKPDSTNVRYVQKGYSPYHFKNEDGYWVSIDHRLRPTNGQADLYLADRQPNPTRYNSADHSAALSSSDWYFAHNSKLNAYYLDANGKRTDLGMMNRNQETIGADGVYTTNAWPNMDTRQIFGRGRIKTEHMLYQNPGVTDGWLVFEDRFTLPSYMSLVKDHTRGSQTPEGDWMGYLMIQDDKGNERITWKTPQYYDGYGHIMPGAYRITQNGNSYVVATLVPADFLNSSDVSYPLIIDPVLYATDSVGNFTSDDNLNLNSANMLFSSAPDVCSYDFNMTVPGGSEITDSWVDLEYEINLTNACGQASQACQFMNVRMEIKNVECNSTTGLLSCNPAQAPFLGTCTSDEDLVPGAGPLNFPNMLTCIPPQCPDYSLHFVLENSETLCNTDSCTNSCAIAHYMGVTVQYCTIENVAEISRTTICAGDTVTLTSGPYWGVPPYTVVWEPPTPNPGTSTLPDTGISIIATFEEGQRINAVAYDACGNQATGVRLTLNTTNSPSADAGEDVAFCAEAGAPPITLGGSPTTTATNATYQWTAVPTYAEGWLTSTVDANPEVNLPTDSTGEFTYVVYVEDPLCFRRDTVVVNASDGPEPLFVNPNLVLICDGEAATLSLTESYAGYSWSNGSTTATIDVTEAGTYTVTVTDDNGCTASSNELSTEIKPVPELEVSASPDNRIDLGESATLSANINLNGPDIDNYVWSPDTDISCLDCTEPVVNPEEDQVYQLEISTDGCLISDTILIDVVFPNAYWIPKAFSPNADGHNDRFYIIKQSGVTVLEFRIYNRWGELIYDDARFPWDGMHRATMQDMGVYTYIFRLQLSDGTEVVESGDVTLVR